MVRYETTFIPITYLCNTNTNSLCNYADNSHKNKPTMKQDHRLVASKEDYEVEYISNKFSLSKDVVMQIMKDLGKDGKFCRSRRMIYAKIREMKQQSDSINRGLEAISMQEAKAAQKQHLIDITGLEDNEVNEAI